MGGALDDGRHVKGLNLRGVVVVLRAWARHHGAPRGGWSPAQATDMGPARVHAKSRLTMATFLEALALWHGTVLDGSDAAAQRMGELGAKTNAQVHGAAIRPSARESLAAFPRAWRRNFDFGELAVTDTDDGVEVAFRGYDDSGRVHGLLHVGWFRTLVELSGGRDVRAHPITRPWVDGRALRIGLRFNE